MMKNAFAVLLVALIFIGCNGSPTLMYEYQNDVYISYGDGSKAALIIPNAQYPQWIPRTKDKIAFARFTGSKAAIFIVDDDGKNEVQLTDCNTSGRFSWSPDRYWITFSTDRHGKWQVYKINVNTKKEWRLTHDNSSNHEQPQWSPAGGKIAFHCDRRSGYWDIWIMDEVGHRQTNLTKGVTGLISCMKPVWEPHGKYLAYIGNHPGWGGVKVHVVFNPSFTGSSSPGPFSAHQVLVCEPLWSPSGDYIFYVDSENDVYKQSIETKVAEKINKKKLSASGTRYMDCNEVNLYFCGDTDLYRADWRLTPKNVVKLVKGYNPDVW
ncbi:PD40 domain-containing protein [bacterium]|nr:PD40 domain-containing protein [bacterium]